jgi:phosphoribosylglycinamide formyltransferase-1
MVIADACAAGIIPAEVALVLSDVPDAGILSGARERRIPTRYLAPGKFKTKLDPEAERAYVEALQEAEVDLVVLAGFMRILKSGFLREFPNRVINIHPALLPAFPGLESWKQALDYGAKVAGCTVHYVDEGVDSGPIICQEAVPVMQDDTPASLHARIHAAEWRQFPAAIAAIARGEVTVVGRRTVWKKV